MNHHLNVREGFSPTECSAALPEDYYEYYQPATTNLNLGVTRLDKHFCDARIPGYQDSLLESSYSVAGGVC